MRCVTFFKLKKIFLQSTEIKVKVISFNLSLIYSGVLLLFVVIIHLPRVNDCPQPEKNMARRQGWPTGSKNFGISLFFTKGTPSKIKTGVSFLFVAL